MLLWHRNLSANQRLFFFPAAGQRTRIHVILVIIFDYFLLERRIANRMKVPIVATANTAPADHQLIQFPKMTEVPIPISTESLQATRTGIHIPGCLIASHQDISKVRQRLSSGWLTDHFLYLKISIKISSYLYFIICLNYSFAEFLCGVPIPHRQPALTLSKLR